MADKELTVDEKELLKFAHAFRKFLVSEPQIRYNLHKDIKEIDDKFKVVKNNLI